MRSLGERGRAGTLQLAVSLISGRGELGVPLGDERELDTVALGHLDQRLLGSNDEDVRETRGEVDTVDILHVDDLVGTWVVFNVHERANTTDIVSTSDVHLSAVLEFNNAVDFASLKVKLSRSRNKVLNIIHSKEKKRSRETTSVQTNLPSQCRSS